MIGISEKSAERKPEAMSMRFDMVYYTKEGCQVKRKNKAPLHRNSNEQK